MFRVQNNVPEVYVQESRDFQLFCRLYDSIFCGTKFSIDSLQYSASPSTSNERLLELMQTKLGLFTDFEVSDKSLRLILQSLPTIIRYKGSLLGIKYVIRLYQRILGATQGSIEIEHESDPLKEKKFRDNLNAGILSLIFVNTPVDDSLMQKLLYYVLPTGFIVEYYVKTSNDKDGMFSVQSTASLTVVKTLDADDKDYIHDKTVGLAEIPLDTTLDEKQESTNE